MHYNIERYHYKKTQLNYIQQRNVKIIREPITIASSESENQPKELCLPKYVISSTD